LQIKLVLLYLLKVFANIVFSFYKNKYEIKGKNASLDHRDCLNFARRINQIDFLGEFQLSLGKFSGLNETNESWN